MHDYAPLGLWNTENKTTEREHRDVGGRKCNGDLFLLDCFLTSSKTKLKRGTFSFPTNNCIGECRFEDFLLLGNRLSGEKFYGYWKSNCKTEFESNKDKQTFRIYFVRLNSENCIFCLNTIVDKKQKMGCSHFRSYILILKI